MQTIFLTHNMEQFINKKLWSKIWFNIWEFYNNLVIYMFSQFNCEISFEYIKNYWPLFCYSFLIDILSIILSTDNCLFITVIPNKSHNYKSIIRNILW